MKIAFTATGNDLDSQVDPCFGRAQQFVVVDTDTEAFEAHDNTMNLQAASGAGIQAARFVAELGAHAVVTGNVGPKAYATLSAAGVEVYVDAGGTVREALEAWRAGRLAGASGPTVEGRH